MEREKLIPEEITAEATPPVLLDCPNCHSFIGADHINEERQIATCGHCQHVFSFQKDGYWDPFGLPTETRPEGLEVLRLPTFLEISQEMKGDKTNLALVLLFTAFWNGTLLFLLGQLITIGQLSYIPFMLIHLLVGLLLIVSSMSMLFNRTIFHMDDRQLMVEVKPIGFLYRKKVLPKQSIKQLFVKKRTDDQGVSYDLQVLTVDNRKVTLLSFLDKNTLYYIEREVEKYFGIMDYPVKE